MAASKLDGNYCSYIAIILHIVRYEVCIAFRRRRLEVAIENHFRDSLLVLTRVRKLQNNRPVSSLVRPYTVVLH